MHKGTPEEKTLYTNEEVIPYILEKPVNSLGRLYNSTLSDRGQVAEIRKDIAKAINATDKTFLPGKLKLWRLQFGLWQRWPCD